MIGTEIVGSRKLSSKDAKAAAEILSDVLKGGEADTVECRKALIERSRPKNSPTHDLFDWDVKKHTEFYLMSRAGEIIRSILVVFEDKPDVPVRAFPVLLKPRGGGQVQAIQRVLTSRDATQTLLQQAQAEALAWAKRYEHLRERAELSGIFRAIDKMVKTKTKAA